MGLISRIKDWVDGEILTEADLDAEFNNITDFIVDATTITKGLVMLEDSHASTSVTKAACPKNVKEAYDLANGLVSDTVYGVGWNGVTTVAPSKNAIYDKIETLGGGDGDVVGPATHAASYVPQWNATPDSKTLVEGFAITAAGKALIDDADAAAQRTTLGLIIGTNVQAQNLVLTDIAAISIVADNEFIVGTGAGMYSHQSGATVRTSLGLGSAALRAAEDTMTDGSNLPDGAAIKVYGDANWSGAASLWTDGGTYSYLTEEAGNTRLHNSGLLSLEATGGTTHPLIAANKWGFSSSFTETGDRLLVLGTGDHTSSPAIWIEKDYISAGTPTGDPTIPVGIYVGHEHTGAGVGFTHSIMGYALNNGTGNNDVIAVSGRARKLGAGVGDACGIWGSAYNDVNQNGGVMALEGSIYQNAAGLAAGQDNMGVKWSVACHLTSVSTTENALAALAIDASNSYGFWNGILFDKEMWRDAVGGTAGMAGTVGINMGDFDDTHKPQYGIKFGYAHAHIKCTDSLSLESDKSLFSYINGTENFVWRKGTYTSSSDLMILKDTGELTIPKQPAFLARLTQHQYDVTGDNTAYNITGAIWTEIFDQGADFLNGTFTAPVTGKYLFTGTVNIGDVAAAHTAFWIWLITSNRTYTLVYCNPGAIRGGADLTSNFSVFTDMDAADTAYLRITVAGSTKIIDAKGTYTTFQGALIC